MTGNFYRNSYIKCACCDVMFLTKETKGRLPKYCSPGCKQQAYRRRKPVQQFRNKSEVKR